MGEHVAARARRAFYALTIILVHGGIGWGALFQGVGIYNNGSQYSYARDVSSDGSIVVGRSGEKAFSWTKAAGLVPLDRLATQVGAAGAWGISGDGTTIVGDAYLPSETQAFGWSKAAGMSLLGTLPGGIQYNGVGYAASADGSVVVGLDGWTDSPGHGSNRWAPFRWAPETGMIGLGYLKQADTQGSANGVSADGQVVVGYSGSQAFRWTSASGMTGLPYLATRTMNSNAYAVSSDGHAIVGYCDAGANTGRAVVWSDTGDVLNLGVLSGGSVSVAYDVCDEGSVVGYSNTGFGGHAVLWDSNHQIHDLNILLATDLHLNLAGWTLTAANAISDDGLTIVGDGLNPAGKKEGWIAVIPEPMSLSISILSCLGLLCRRRHNSSHAADYTMTRDGEARRDANA